MKKNVLLTMLLMVATMALAACTEKKGTTMRQNTAAQTDTFKTKSGKTIIFTAIKHASIRINFDSREIEVDPVRGLKPTTDYSRFPKADFILVTHEHFDHCDTAAIRQLEKPTTVIVTNANCAKMIKSLAWYRCSTLMVPCATLSRYRSYHSLGTGTTEVI